MAFMGGQPRTAYEERDFVTTATWIDDELRAVVARDELAPEGVGLDDAARVSCCVRLRP
jgi:hypothetical protein